MKKRKNSFSRYRNLLKKKQKRFQEKIQSLMLKKTGKVRKVYSKKKYVSQIPFNIHKD